MIAASRHAYYIDVNQQRLSWNIYLFNLRVEKLLKAHVTFVQYYFTAGPEIDSERRHNCLSSQTELRSAQNEVGGHVKFINIFSVVIFVLESLVSFMNFDHDNFVILSPGKVDPLADWQLEVKYLTIALAPNRVLSFGSRQRNVSTQIINEISTLNFTDPD